MYIKVARGIAVQTGNRADIEERVMGLLRVRKNKLCRLHSRNIIALHYIARKSHLSAVRKLSDHGGDEVVSRTVMIPRLEDGALGSGHRNHVDCSTVLDQHEK